MDKNLPTELSVPLSMYLDHWSALRRRMEVLKGPDHPQLTNDLLDLIEADMTSFVKAVKTTIPKEKLTETESSGKLRITPFANTEAYEEITELATKSKDDQWKSVPRPVVFPLSRSLVLLIRQGIPQNLRTEMWASLTGADSQLATRPKLFDSSVISTFPFIANIQGNTLDERLARFVPRKVPSFGGGAPYMHVPLNDEGMRYTKIILCVLGQHTQVEHCPTLPLLVAILLLYLPPAKAYVAARNLIIPGNTLDKYHCIPASPLQCRLTVEVFRFALKAKLPQIARHLERLKVDITPRVQQWFDSLYVFAVPLPIALCVFDAFLAEGTKVLTRCGLAILKTLEREILRSQTPEELEMRLHHGPAEINDVGALMQKAYSLQLSRKELEAWESRVSQELSGRVEKLDRRLSMHFRPTVLNPSNIVLEQGHWDTLFHWVANVRPSVEWELAYAASQEGFSLRTLYHKCHNIGANIILIKAIPHRGPGTIGDVDPEIFGTFNTHSLQISKGYFGNGFCFVFKLHPREHIFTSSKSDTADWNAGDPQVVNDEDEDDDDDKLDDDAESNNWFIRCERHLMAFGAGGEGAALEINSDLQSGTTYRSNTYNNEKLCSANLFDILGLEVFLIR